MNIEAGGMIKRTLQIATTCAVAAALWVVPSVGTRGQGTLGDRFVHADRSVVGNGAAARATLMRADAAVAAAVAAF